MAEGKTIDPTELNQVDPDDGDKESESIQLTSTSIRHVDTPYGIPRNRGDEDHETETSFIVTDENTPLLQVGERSQTFDQMLASLNESDRRIKIKFPRCDVSKFISKVDENDIVLVKVKERFDAVFKPLLDQDNGIIPKDLEKKTRKNYLKKSWQTCRFNRCEPHE